jgi:hypothetical protein
LRSTSTLQRLADARLIEGELVLADALLQALEAFIHHFCGDLAVHRGGGRAGARGVFEAEAGGIAHVIDDPQRVFEFRFGLARKADDEIARQRDIGPRGAEALKDAQIAVPPCAGGSSP